MILPLLITLALIAVATGVTIGSRLTERAHRADLIHQAAIIRGSVADGRIRKAGRS